MEKKIVRAALSQIKRGSLKLVFWDGEVSNFGEGLPKVRVTINKPGIVSRAVKNPSVALGEAYMDGHIDTDSVLNLMKLVSLNPVVSEGNRIRRVLKLNKNIRSKQKNYIAQHYDRGNDFYKLWLDSTMCYSCAYFHSPRDSLEKAQQQKTDHILRKLQLSPGMSLLDIGSGWGYLLVQAAKKYRIRGVGVTLSEQQYEYSVNLAKQSGVDKLVSFRLQNYLDIPKREKYDRIVSVGFYEHVGRGNHKDYFEALKRHLNDDGISVLYCITHQNETSSSPWIDKYIFPGGYIPSVRETTALMPRYGFYLFDYENMGQHYAMTIERWYSNYEKQKAKVIKLYDERFYRMWQLYLAGAMMTFKTGNSHLSQWTFKKGQNPSWPLTREYLYSKT